MRGTAAARAAADRAVGREAAARRPAWRSSSSPRRCSWCTPQSQPGRAQPDDADRARAGWPRSALSRPIRTPLLIRADQLWRTVQGMLRITVGAQRAGDLPDASAAQPLLRAIDRRLDLPGLRATIDETAPTCARHSFAMWGRSGHEHRSRTTRHRISTLPASGGRTVSLAAMQGQAVRAVFLSQGGHAGLHQGGAGVPGGAAATRQVSAST